MELPAETANHCAQVPLISTIANVAIGDRSSLGIYEPFQLGSTNGGVEEQFTPDGTRLIYSDSGIITDMFSSIIENYRLGFTRQARFVDHDDIATGIPK